MYVILKMEEENIQLVVQDLYDPLDDPQFRCDVCGMTFFKRYLSLNANRKAVEKHKLSRTHELNVERANQGLPPQRICNFTNMHGQMQELVDKMSMRIAELETLVRSVTEESPGEQSHDELESASTDCSVDEPHNHKQTLSHREQREERNPPESSNHHTTLLVTPPERNVLCEYDGETLSNMRAVRAILTRLLLRLRDVSCGDKYEKNFQFISRTNNAISVQLERLREGYPLDDAEVDEIAYRLTQIAVHQF
jgi:hypothetical protein